MMKMLRGLIALALALVGSLPAIAATPREDIAARAAPAPDYALPANWAAGPDAPSAGPVDVFYVHPTTFRSDKGEWTQTPGDPAADKWTDESVIVRQGGAFAGCCRVWAPRYRAASFNALQSEAHRDEAFAFAYADVERAFDWFLANVSKGRPFILAGHSQGGKHISDLLEKRIDGTDHAGANVAAVFGRTAMRLFECARGAGLVNRRQARQQGGLDEALEALGELLPCGFVGAGFGQGGMVCLLERIEH